MRTAIVNLLVISVHSYHLRQFSHWSYITIPLCYYYVYCSMWRFLMLSPWPSCIFLSIPKKNFCLQFNLQPIKTFVCFLCFLERPCLTMSYGLFRTNIQGSLLPDLLFWPQRSRPQAVCGSYIVLSLYSSLIGAPQGIVGGITGRTDCPPSLGESPTLYMYMLILMYYRSMCSMC